VIQHYHVNMAEAEQQNLQDFQSFNHFFTRSLRADARPITALKTGIAMPADAVVSQAGFITAGEIFQAKGKTFTTLELLGGDAELAAQFDKGLFATLYLSPKDYHRLHMPLRGQLREMIHIPGRLFSVNHATTKVVSRLFARNERVVCIFDTAIGTMALILVGAIFVSSIETVWHGVVTPPTSHYIRRWQYPENPPILEKGAEMGRFNMGSTIIVLFPQNAAYWQPDFIAGKAVKMGELMGHTL
jgi:phosphatidylserine decarboxylase